MLQLAYFLLLQSSVRLKLANNVFLLNNLVLKLRICLLPYCELLLQVFVLGLDMVHLHLLVGLIPLVRFNSLFQLINFTLLLVDHILEVEVLLNFLVCDISLL